MDILKSKVEELVVNAAIEQARYLFCFNGIVKALEDKETNLKEEQDGINKAIEEERQKHCAIVVEKDVEKWLEDVDKEMADVQNLKAKIAEKDSCLHGLCPNWGCRYCLDKEFRLPIFFSSFETTESACNQIIEALKKDNIKMVGLHGLGGVGKTTLAKVVGNRLRQENIFDEQVCDRMGCDTQIKLDALDQAEGLDLLRKHAIIDVADSTLIDVSKRVADECKGLPIAIKAVGSALRGRTADEWNVALDKLQNAKLDKIEEMPALKVVTIIGGVLSLKSLQFLANNLRVLQLIRCEVTDASFLGKLKRLQILYLKKSPIEIPEGLGDELSRLELLYIDTGSISPITINKFPQIEEFYGVIKDWEVEGMSSEESYARCAESDSQPDGYVVCLPKDFSFPKLQRYDINKADNNDCTIYRGIRRLYIKNNRPKATLVIFSALYPELENLYLNRVRGCRNIVPSIDERGLNELTILHVTDCKDLECIMDASKSPHRKSGNPVMLSRLAELYMSELPELKWIWKAPT
ncbi:hypothetical protein AB3S75_043024 [Citrus x aurantiifolia]